MSSADLESHVHLGLWTDWSRGATFGRTLTVSRTDANLLIAFTASFIAFVATRFWRVLCLAIHRGYSTSGPQGALHRQRQVILRNSADPENGLVSLIRLSWAWRQMGCRKLLHLVLLVFVAALTVSAFAVAGGFSSTISSAVGNIVLVNSAKCGFIGLSPNASLIGPGLTLVAEQLNNAANYAQQCYGNNSSGTLGCGRFVVDRAPWVANTSALCPFDGSLCRTNDSNIFIDTGHLDTNDILGLNAPTNERSSFRYVLSCAPLVTEGFTSRENTSSGSFVQYHHGELLKGPVENQTMYNYTYRTNDIESQYSHLRNPDAPNGFNFRLGSLKSITMDGQPSTDPSVGAVYVPLPSLQRSDGDVTIVYLSGDGVNFDQPMEDEWYRATAFGGRRSQSGTNGSANYYIPEEAASPLGCVEQYQYCNLARPKGSDCGPLGSFNDAIVGAAPFFNSTVEEMQEGNPPLGNPEATRLYWIAMIENFNPSALDSLLKQLAAKSLASQSQLYDGIQYSPLPNQWQDDVTNWFATLLAAMQAAYISTAIGPDDAMLDDIRISPTDALQQELCNSQKIRSTTYASFSLFGLCFIYTTGGLIILISVITEPILRFLHKRYRHQSYQQLEWTTNQQLQLLRLAHEGLGHGTWTKCTDLVPITERDELLGNFDITQIDHPVIMGTIVKNEYGAAYQHSTSSHDEVVVSDTPISEHAVLTAGGPPAQGEPVVEEAAPVSEETAGGGVVQLNDIIQQTPADEVSRF